MVAPATLRPATRLNAVTSLVARKRDIACSEASNEATTVCHAIPPAGPRPPRPRVSRKGDAMARPSNRVTGSSLMAEVVVGQPPDAPVEALVFGRVVVRTTTFVETAGRRTRAGSAWAAPLTASTRAA